MQVPPSPAFIARHSAPEGEVWIIDPDRGNRPAFNRHMAAQGFLVREERSTGPPQPAVRPSKAAC